MRYTTYHTYCLKTFGRRMQKLAIDAGFGCPNRDGTLGTGGCTFCNNAAFSPAYCQPTKSIAQQIDEGVRFYGRRNRGGCGYLAYLQSFSNTYARLEILKEKYAEALSHPQIEGLVIGTRPDCVDGERLDYIAALGGRHYVMLEYGIESCYDATLAGVGRGHDFAATVSAIRATAERGIPCGGHLILGLPGESREDMVAEAEILSGLPITSLKLHQLQLLRGSQMGRDYGGGVGWEPFTLGEYVCLVCDFLERLRPDIVVERLAGEVPPRYQVGPGCGWRHADGRPVRSGDLCLMVDAELGRRGTAQGIFFN